MVATLEATIAPSKKFKHDKSRRYTLAEFFDLPIDGSQYELINGELIQMKKPGPNWKHGDVVAALSQHLRNYVIPAGLGRVFSGAACVPDPTSDNYVIPDVAFVSRERLVGQAEDGPITVAPDLVVEVNSPSDKVGDIHKKIKAYRRVGVRLIWSVYPLDELVVVYTNSSKRVALLNPDEELAGGSVLPGFKLQVSALFE